MAIANFTRTKMFIIVVASSIVVALLVIGTILGSNQSKDNANPTEEKSRKSALNVGIQINDSPGFSVMKDGQRSGFDIDLANYIAEGLGRHANFIPITVGSRNEQLKNEYVDMVVSTYSITDAHIADGIIFAGPYIRTEQGIMVANDNDMIASTDDLAGQTVCVTSGSTSASKLDALRARIPLIATYRDTMNQCIEDLKNPASDVTAVTNDAIILQAHARADANLKFLPGVTVPGTYEKYGIGIAKKNIALCRQIAPLVKKFINTQWNSAFAANIQGESGLLASSIKPDANNIDTESCRTE